jgi:hypothetical protein
MTYRNKSWIAFAFYTPGTRYEKLARRLAASAQDHNIELSLVSVPSLGNWWANCQLKPQMIARALAENEARHVLYIDADAWFCNYPALLDNYEYELAAYWLGHYRSLEEIAYYENCVCCAGTIWLHNNERTRAFIDSWCRIVSDMPGLFEQDAFGQLYKENRTGLHVALTLPPEYCAVCLPNDAGIILPENPGLTMQDVVIAQGRQLMQID